MKRWLYHLWRLPTYLALFSVHAYQWTLGPLLGGQCRFTPSCSNYALGALRKYGFMRGCWKSVWRICRCHPFHPGGHDPP